MEGDMSKKMLSSVNGEVGLDLVMIIVAVVIVVFSLCRGAFVSDDIAYRAAKNQGFSNVKVVDDAWFAVGLRGCSSHDAARFTIHATNPAGDEVECYVCSGWLFKGATIRTK
jgi:hypothetical protein